MKIFRWKGIIAFAVVFGLAYVATVYYMDAAIRRVVIKQGTRLNGALIDIDRLSLSFLQSRFQMKGVRATDPDDLMKNRIDIGSIVVDLQFLPLLRKKFIVDNVSVVDVRWATSRKKPGEIPTSWKKEWDAADKKDEGPSPWSKAYESLKGEVVTQLPELDLDKLGDRFDPRSIVKVEELESYKTARALPGEFQNFGKDWKAKAGNFASDQAKKAADLKSKVEKLNPQAIKNPSEVLKAIEMVKGVKGEAEGLKKSVTSMADDAKKAVEEQAGKLASIRKSFDTDLSNLKKKIGLGNFDLNRMSQSIFGLPIVERYRKFLRYYTQFQSYMAKREKDKATEAPKQERARGRDILFPVTHQLPGFLLSKLALSADSRTNETVPGPYRGLYELTGERLTSDLSLISQPATVKLSADMKEGKFSKAGLNASFDRAKELLHTRVEGNVAGYTLSSVVIGKGTVFPVGFEKGEADWTGKVDILGDEIEVSAAANFKNLIHAAANSGEKGVHPIVKILRDVLKTIRAFTLKVTLSGRLDSPKLKIESTFDDELRKGMEGVLMDKIRKAQAKLEAYLRKEIGTHLDSAKSVLEAQKKQLLGPLNDQLAKVTDLEKLADRKLNELKKKQLGGMKSKLPTDPSKLKKKLPF